MTVISIIKTNFNAFQPTSLHQGVRQTFLKQKLLYKEITYQYECSYICFTQVYSFSIQRTVEPTMNPGSFHTQSFKRLLCV